MFLLWTDGYAFLERFYTYYDTSNSKIGIANTPFTQAKVNYTTNPFTHVKQARRPFLDSRVPIICISTDFHPCLTARPHT